MNNLYIISKAIQDTEIQMLYSSIQERIASDITNGKYSNNEIVYINKISFLPNDLMCREKELEIIRNMCKVWDGEIKIFNIASHRKILGPIIVKFKKLLLPILKGLLKDYIRQQKLFNATVIDLELKKLEQCLNDN